MTTNFKAITLEPTLSEEQLDGPWQVVAEHPTDPKNWYIYNTITGRFKRIGSKTAPKLDFGRRARMTARGLNIQARGG